MLRITLEHPFIIPPKKYHMTKNIISSITADNLIDFGLIILSSDDKK